MGRASMDKRSTEDEMKEGEMIENSINVGRGALIKIEQCQTQ